MKFRTEIELASFAEQIGYADRVLALGSCFAEHIAARLSEAKFRVTANPTGIVFNPLSVAAAIRDYATPVRREELQHDGEKWFHYGFHGDFSHPDADQALTRMNAARQAGATALRDARFVLITFGTAWVYEHNGQVVANCHRQSAAEFVRRRLSVEEIVDAYSTLFNGPLKNKHIILTVSPVRHLGDGAEGNAVSKAVLRLAAEELVQRFKCAVYFPAYELLTDDLRDYRFYADDLVHPAPQAIGYIWEKFSASVLSDKAQQLLPEVEAIAAAAAHRPRNPLGESHLAFCRRSLERIAALRGVDFHDEEAYFRRCLEKKS